MKRFSAIDVGIVLSTIATAVIHFYLNVLMGKLDILFTLNGLGYLALLAALYLPLPGIRIHPRLVRFALMGFTAITILAWVVMGERSPLGYVDKIIEIILIVQLFFKRP